LKGFYFDTPKNRGLTSIPGMENGKVIVYRLDENTKPI
jgi:hypothetical protein